MKIAYQEFEERVGQTAEPKGAKAELVRDAVRKRQDDFRLSDIEQACSGVGREWIRNVLAEENRCNQRRRPYTGAAFRRNLFDARPGSGEKIKPPFGGLLWTLSGMARPTRQSSNRLFEILGEWNVAIKN